MYSKIQNKKYYIYFKILNLYSELHNLKYKNLWECMKFMRWKKLTYLDNADLFPLLWGIESWDEEG